MRARAPRRVPLGPRGGRLRPVLAALAVVALCAAGPLAAAPAAPAADATAGPDAPAVTVTRLSPDVGRPGGTLRVAGRARSGAEPVAGSIVRMRVSTQPVATRSELQSLADGTTERIGVQVASEAAPTDLAAGATRSWALSAPLDPLALPAAGVYPVIVTLESTTTGATLDRVTTFLSWFPTGSLGVPTRVVWSVPLVGTPSRDADGVFVNDRTAASIAPGGRARTLLDALAGTPTSWVVDPELLEAARDMSDGYQVRTEDGEVVDGGAAGAAAGASFLAKARSTLSGAEVASLGYADPDVNALQRAGLTGDLTLATTTGPAITSRLLGRPVRSNLGWPPGGAVERPTLATLRAAGVTSVVLSDAALPVDATVPFTPTGLARIPTAGGAVTAALADSTISAVVNDPAAYGGDALAKARYLAETLVITQQRPSDPRTILVAPTRAWDVDATFARDLVTMSRRAPWLKATTLGRLLREPLPDVPRGTLTYPDTARALELGRLQTDGARRLGDGITTFTGILVDPAATASRYTAAQLRTESAAFRVERAAGLSLLSAISTNLDRDRAKVRVLSRGTVTLSGASGQIPITVANDLDQSVVVQVEVRPSAPVRLRVEQPGETRLGPHKKETIEVSARAATSGTVPIAISLLTRGDERYDEPVILQVRSTAYSRVGLTVVGVALAALALLVVARLVRRVRSRAATS